jgi:hypothetical protein
VIRKIPVRYEAGLRRPELSIYTERLLRPRTIDRKPGAICCVFFGATVPFILRKVDEASHYKLIGEAYIHGLMRGEAVNLIPKDEQQEEFILS